MNDKTGIIGALEDEVATLIARMEDTNATVIAGMTFYEGTLHGAPVVVVRCGIGKVNAAMCAQSLIDRLGATRVINTGVAGSLDPTLGIGGLVVSTDAVQHDMDVTGLDFEPGVVPDLGTAFFPASIEMRQAVLQAVADEAPQCSVREGRVASGDQFVSSREASERIVRLFDASCCEMEGASIAQVCYRNDVPFVIVRTISDGANDDSANDYSNSKQVTAELCADIVSRAIELLD